MQAATGAHGGIFGAAIVTAFDFAASSTQHGRSFIAAGVAAIIATEHAARGHKRNGQDKDREQKPFLEVLVHERFVLQG